MAGQDGQESVGQSFVQQSRDSPVRPIADWRMDPDYVPPARNSVNISRRTGPLAGLDRFFEAFAPWPPQISRGVSESADRPEGIRGNLRVAPGETADRFFAVEPSGRC